MSTPSSAARRKKKPKRPRVKDMGVDNTTAMACAVMLKFNPNHKPAGPQGGQFTSGPAGSAPTRNGGHAAHTADDVRQALGYQPEGHQASPAHVYRAVSHADYQRIMNDPKETLDSKSGDTYTDVDPGAAPFRIAQRQGRVIMKIETPTYSVRGPGMFILPKGLNRDAVKGAVAVASPHVPDTSDEHVAAITQPVEPPQPTQTTPEPKKQGIGVGAHFAVGGKTVEEVHRNAWNKRERYAGDAVAASAAHQYRQEHGLPEPKFVEGEGLKTIQANLGRARTIVAQAEAAKERGEKPDAKTVAAYDDLVKQAQAQLAMMKRHGINVEFLSKQEIIDRGLDPEGLNPYPTARAQRDDVQRNHRLMIASLSDYPESYHPILDSSKGGAYDQFRAVHDYFGHVAPGTGFDRHGELEAWLHHMSMFYGPAAQAASSELTLENSYLATHPGESAPHFAHLLPNDVVQPYDQEGNFKGEGWLHRLSYHTKGLLPIMLKGDKPGHDFHGNQYKPGVSGGSTPPTPGEGPGEDRNPSGLEAVTPDAMRGLIDQAVENGGFTWHPHDGSTPTTGYQVGGMRPGHEIPFTNPHDEQQQRAVAKAMVAELRSNADIYNNRNIYLGGWYDSRSGNFVIEPSQNISDRSSAILHGVDRNQVSIWDDAAAAHGDYDHAEVQTGGSGEYRDERQRHYKQAGPRPSSSASLRRRVGGVVPGPGEGGSGRALPVTLTPPTGQPGGRPAAPHHGPGTTPRRAFPLLTKSAVEGVEAVAKFNHNHRGKGPGGGEFTSGPEAGAGSPHPADILGPSARPTSNDAGRLISPHNALPDPSRGKSGRADPRPDNPHATELSRLSPETQRQVKQQVADATEVMFGRPMKQADIEANIEAMLEESLSKDHAAVEEGKVWYQHAHDLAQDISGHAGVPLRNVVGMIAAMSPNSYWEENIDMARYFAQTLHDDPVVDVTPEQLAAINDQAIHSKPNEKHETIANGQRLSEMTPMQAAIALKGIGQMVIGKTVPGVKIKDGSRDRRYQWTTGLANMAKAVEMYRGADPDQVLGGHKTRSFFNNIADPQNKEGRNDVTMDSHAVSLAVGARIANSAPQLDKLFTTGQVKRENVSGTYSLFADAYRAVAAKHGLQPNQLQAITWVHWRNLDNDERFPDFNNKTAWRSDRKRNDRRRARVAELWAYEKALPLRLAPVMSHV